MSGGYVDTSKTRFTVDNAHSYSLTQQCPSGYITSYNFIDIVR